MNAFIRIAILDAYDNILSFMDNSLNDSMHYFNETLHNYLEGTASTFSFSVYSHHEDSEHLVVGNKLAFIYNDRDYYFNIISVDEDEYTKSVEAFGTSLELLNQYCASYESPSAKTFEQYLTYFRMDDVLKVDINEVDSKTLKLEWTSEDTLLNRLFSLATNFDAEIEIIPVLRNNYSLEKLVLNIYKEHTSKNQGIGRPHNEYLRYGDDVSGITRTVDISDLYTAIVPIGKDGLTIKTLEKEEVNSDGEVEYFTKKDSKIIYAPLAKELFPSNLMKGNNHYIEYRYSYETKNVNTLYSKALSQLKKFCKPKVTYTIDGYVDANIGDTFTVIDEAFREPIYISARVTEQEISFTDPTRNKTTFDNFIEKKSRIDQSLIDMMTQIAREESTESDSIIVEIRSASGTAFYNTSINTVLYADIYLNGVRQTDISSLGVINWYDGDTLIGSGNQFTLTTDMNNITVSCRLESD